MTVTLLVKVIVVHWIRAWHGGHGIVVVAVTGGDRDCSVRGAINRAGAGAGGSVHTGAGGSGHTGAQQLEAQASSWFAASSSQRCC